jgi:hypothetical protein
MFLYDYMGSNIKGRTQAQGDKELGDEENVQDLRGKT